jgi:hypothetical protein
VISAQIGELELMEVWYEDDPTMRVKVNFPFFLGRPRFLWETSRARSLRERWR